MSSIHAPTSWTLHYFVLSKLPPRQSCVLFTDEDCQAPVAEPEVVNPLQVSKDAASSSRSKNPEKIFDSLALAHWLRLDPSLDDFTVAHASATTRLS